MSAIADDKDKRQKYLNAFHEVLVFQDLKPELIDNLLNDATERTFKEGDDLIIQNMEVREIMVIIEGDVEVLVNEQRVAHRSFGDCIGEMSCIRGERLASATVRAVTDTETLCIPIKSFLSVMNRSSKNWKLLSQEVTNRFQDMNIRFSEVLNHTPQGLLKIDREGNITKEFSAICSKYFGTSNVTGKNFANLLLKEHPTVLKAWNSIYPTLFDDNMDFNILRDFLPKEVDYLNKNDESWFFSLKYYPCKNHNNEIIAIDVSIEDITKIKQFTTQSEKLKKEKEILRNIYDSPDVYLGMLNLVDSILTEFKHFSDSNVISLMSRLHNLKGNAGIFELDRLVEKAHSLETLLKQSADLNLKTFNQNKSILKGVEELETEYHYSKELLDNISEDLKRRLFGIVISKENFDLLNNAAETEDLEEVRLILSNIEEVPAKKLIFDWPKEVERLSERLKKEISIEVRGQDLNIPKRIFNDLNPPLIHILRNAADHAIENPKQRLKLGKPANGTIEFKVSKMSNFLILEFKDDGRGIDFSVIEEKARKNEQLDQKKIESLIQDGRSWEILFLPEFSSSEEVTEFSGRGVGLSSIKEVVSGLSGEIEVETQKNLGTTFIITIPISTESVFQPENSIQ